MTYRKKGLRIALCLSLLTLVPVRSMAQDNDDFSPDAPGATTGVSIMPQGKVDGKLVSRTNGTGETVRMNVHGLSTHQYSVSE